MEKAVEIENGFKETKIGLIPKEWKIKKLMEVAIFTKKRRNLDLRNCKKIPFIPMSLIPTEGLYILGYHIKSGNEISSGVYCEIGDILLPKITPCFENGKQAIVADIPCDYAIATTEVYPIKPEDEINRLFLFYFLKRNDIRKIIANKMQGTTGRKRVPRDIVENFPIPLPLGPEQRKISSILFKLQNAIEYQDKIIETTKNLRKTIMKKLFTEGIGHTAFKDTELEQIPSMWKIGKLSEVTHIVLGQSPPSETYNVESKGLPFLQGKAEFGEIYPTPVKWCSQPIRIADKGDILISVRAPVGDVNIAPFTCCIGRGLAAFKPLSELDGSYLFYYMVTAKKRIENEGHGTTFKAIGKSVLKNFKIPLPPFLEQKEIAHNLSVVDKKIQVEERRKSILKQLFKTMLNKLMSGKIRVNDLDLGVYDVN